MDDFCIVTSGLSAIPAWLTELAVTKAKTSEVMTKTLGTTKKHDSLLLNWPQLLFEAVFVPLFSGC